MDDIKCVEWMKWNTKVRWYLVMSIKNEKRSSKPIKVLNNLLNSRQITFWIVHTVVMSFTVIYLQKTNDDVTTLHDASWLCNFHLFLCQKRSIIEFIWWFHEFSVFYESMNFFKKTERLWSTVKVNNNIHFLWKKS